MIDTVGPYLVSRAFIDGMLAAGLGAHYQPFIRGRTTHTRPSKQRLCYRQGRCS